MGTNFLLGAPALNHIFSPIDLPTLVLWLKSTLGITKDLSDLVSLWEDQSLIGNDFSASGAGLPLWVANQINGHPAILGDGIDDIMTNAGPIVTGGASRTVFVVAKTFEAGGLAIYLDQYVTTGADYPNVLLTYDAGPNQVEIASDVLSENVYITRDDFPFDSWKYLTFACDALPGGYDFSINGVPQVSAGGAVQAPNSSDTRFNIFAGLSYPIFTKFYLAEMLVFTPRLSVGDVAKVEAYLASQYSL